MSSIDVITVEKPSDMKDFIDLPWKIYRDHPNWVPPLKREVRRLLDPEKHPFWRFSDRKMLRGLQKRCISSTAKTGCWGSSPGVI